MRTLIFSCMITVMILQILPILLDCYTKKFVTTTSNMACAVSLFQTILFFASGAEPDALTTYLPAMHYVMSVTLTANSGTILTMLFATVLGRILVYFLYRK